MVVAVVRGGSLRFGGAEPSILVVSLLSSPRTGSERELRLRLHGRPRAGGGPSRGNPAASAQPAALLGPPSGRDPPDPGVRSSPARPCSGAPCPCVSRPV